MPPHWNGDAGFRASKVVGEEPCWLLDGDSTTTYNYATNEDAEHIRVLYVCEIAWGWYFVHFDPRLGLENYQYARMVICVFWSKMAMTTIGKEKIVKIKASCEVNKMTI